MNYKFWQYYTKLNHKEHRMITNFLLSIALFYGFSFIAVREETMIHPNIMVIVAYAVIGYSIARGARTLLQMQNYVLGILQNDIG